MVASYFAGFNMIYYSVKEALHKNSEFDRLQINDNIKFKRYWGGIGIDNELKLGKI
jgi:hypothetical protein